MFQFRQQLPEWQFDPLKRYCEQKHCDSLVKYNQIGTGGNDPTITAKMRYAQLVRSKKFTKVTKKQIKILCPGISTDPPLKCNNPIFSENSIGQKPTNCECNSKVSPYFKTLFS